MNRRWLALAFVAASLVLVGCEQTVAETAERPAQVVPVEGTDTSRVTLTSRAAERIGLQTAQVQQLAGGAGTTVPLAAVVYDRAGVTWVYTVAAPLTYVRQKVALARVAGDQAVLQTGPPVGTTVVTVGAAELLGSEYGVEGE
jgi:hypothetical protein